MKELFERWAASFAGCDGGNLAGSIWLCGLEWGGDITGEDLRSWIRQPVEAPPASYTKDHRKECLSYPYNLKAIKLFRALKGRDAETPAEFLDRERCFERDGDYFKLNLYPVPFTNTSPERWRSEFTSLTGLSSRHEYEEWCRQARFPQLRRWMQQGQPRLIVGTGISYSGRFLEAFGESGAKLSSTFYVVNGRKLRIEHSRVNGGATLLAAIYFLGGRHGLNSDASILATGRELAQLLSREGLSL